MMHVPKLAAACAVLLFCSSAFASSQPQANDNKTTEARKADTVDYSHRLEGEFIIRTYHLSNSQSQSDANEALIALRNVLDPSIHIYLVASTNIIVLAAPAQQQQIAQNLLAKLDIPKPTYRLIYTLTEFEDGKRIGTQHYTLTAAEGQRVTLKQGSKVPVLTGGSSAGSVPQFQYLDVGMNFSVEADAAGGGVVLKSKVEQSSVPEDKTISGINEPVIRQAVLEGSALVPFGRPFILGSMDVLGSSRHIDVEVVAEPINQPAPR